MFLKAKYNQAFSTLPQETKTSLNNLIKTSLNGGKGSGEISAGGMKSTISYEPVNVNGKHFLTLYLLLRIILQAM